MGPVSFEALDAGTTREAAMAAAGRLRLAGIRVMSLRPVGDGGADRWQLVVRSDDAARARPLVENPG